MLSPLTLSRLGACLLYHTQQLLSSTFLIFSFAPFRSSEVTAYLSYHIFGRLSTPFFVVQIFSFRFPLISLWNRRLSAVSLTAFSAFRRVLIGQLKYNTTLFRLCQHLFLKNSLFFDFLFSCSFVLINPFFMKR